MDAQFQEFVDLAADVAASGRWETLNKKIEALAANPIQGEEWRTQVLGGLVSQNFSEYVTLKHTFNDSRSDDSVLAWRARNLLELSVWALYCEKSRANARRLYEDYGRDAMGIYNAFERWGMATAKSTEFLAIFWDAKTDLARRAAAEGIDSVDADFKRVSEAADECGIGDQFKIAFKILSKFAHPTAIRMLGAFDRTRAAHRRELFFAWGCLFFRGAFESLEKQL